MSIFISKKEAAGEIKKILAAIANGSPFSDVIVKELDIGAELTALGYEYHKSEKVRDGKIVGTWRHLAESMMLL